MGRRRASKVKAINAAADFNRRLTRKGHAGSGLHVHMSPVRGGQHLPVPQEQPVDRLHQVGDQQVPFRN